MTTPTSFPWVEYTRFLTKDVNSDINEPLCGVDTCDWVLNSINVCNTSKNDIRVNFYILALDDPKNYFMIYNFLVPVNNYKEFTFSKNFTAGDLIYGYSDDVYNKFDCDISIAKLLETAP